MPTVAAVVIGGAIAGSAISVAQAAPDLPAKTPAQLLASIASTQKIPPLTGTVVETADLGLPQFPDLGNSTSLTSLITGSHTLKVYWQDATHFRLAMPQNMTETDFIRNGSTLWLWESASNTVTKYAIPGHGEKRQGKAGKLPALTPQQAASEALKAVGPTTVVRVDSNVSVAGQAAYQLVLAPKDSRSTVGAISIAIDAKTNVPLRVQVFAKGSATPAFQVGYTQVSYVAPASANFDFTPPPGATYDDTSKPQAKQASGAVPAGQAGTYGSGWLTVAEVPEAFLSDASGNPAPSTAPSGSGAFGGDSQAAINAFLGAGKQVSGSWGSGQLIHTSLVNVLIVGNELYVGAVDPSVLEAAVGHVTPAGNGG